MVDKTIRMNLLFDFYGQLLTERQRRFFEMYYAEDLSLGEIAEASGVSRQAVYDIVRRSANSLESFEERLGLVARYERQKAQLERLEQDVLELQQAVQGRSGSEEHQEWLLDRIEQILRLVRNIGNAEE